MTQNIEPQIDDQTYSLAQETLKIAKITMMMQKDTAFYTAVLFSLKQIIVRTMPLIQEITTAATDGKHLYIHPGFFTDLSVTQRIGLLAHEVLHVALDHMHRRGNRDPRVWNVAGDYVINGMLLKAGYQLPAGGLCDSQYDGMSTEQVYDILHKKSDEQKKQLIAKCPQDIQYPEQAKDPSTAVTKEDVADIVLRATTQAKAMGQDPGSLPSEIGIQLQRTINPPLPWNVILQNYLTNFSKDDYTFRRPNRRFLPKAYLPTAHSEAICDLAVCVDTSSSVDDHQFNDFITKIYEMQQLLKPKKISVMAFNTGFVSEQEVDENECPFRKLKFNGRGGTSIKPVHKWIAEKKPTVALIFTDGYFSQSQPLDLSIPLVWLIYNNNRWQSQVGGRVIHYDIPES